MKRPDCMVNIEYVAQHGGWRGSLNTNECQQLMAYVKALEAVRDAVVAKEQAKAALEEVFFNDDDYEDKHRAYGAACAALRKVLKESL